MKNLHATNFEKFSIWFIKRCISIPVKDLWWNYYIFGRYYFRKNSVIDIWQGLKYVFDTGQRNVTMTTIICREGYFCVIMLINENLSQKINIKQHLEVILSQLRKYKVNITSPHNKLWSGICVKAIRKLESILPVFFLFACFFCFVFEVVFWKTKQNLFFKFSHIARVKEFNIIITKTRCVKFLDKLMFISDFK